METELEEANAIATASNHKYEDVNRKLKVVEGDLERIVERAEEFEAKSRDLETQVNYNWYYNLLLYLSLWTNIVLKR